MQHTMLQEQATVSVPPVLQSLNWEGSQEIALASWILMDHFEIVMQSCKTNFQEMHTTHSQF